MVFVAGSAFKINLLASDTTTPPATELWLKPTSWLTVSLLKTALGSFFVQ